jgi:hypothetical protein
MKTVLPQYSATFVSLAQSTQYLAAILAPLLGTMLADTYGLGFGWWPARCYGCWGLP